MQTKQSPPQGTHPDALPPEFDGWDESPDLPTHPSGQVTGYEERSGLPIVRLSQRHAGADPAPKAEAEPKPEAKPDPKPEPKPAEKPKTLQPAGAAANRLQPGSYMQHAKDTQVQLPDGSRGRVAFSDARIARVKRDDGKSVEVRHHELTPLNEVHVKAHTRLIPGGAK